MHHQLIERLKGHELELSKFDEIFGHMEGFRANGLDPYDAMVNAIEMASGHVLDEVFESLPEPKCLAHDELEDTYLKVVQEYAFGMDEEWAFQAFIVLLYFDLLAKRDAASEILAVVEHASDPADMDYQLTIFKINDFEIYLYCDCCRVSVMNVCVSGRVSEKALNMVATPVFNHLHSILISYALAVGAIDQKQLTRYLAGEIPVVALTENHMKSLAEFLGVHVSMCLQPVGKKDTMAKKIQNAAELLYEADKQTNEAVALSLAVAAIEAIVCSGQGVISEQVRTGVGVLLEPDLGHRRKAEKFVSDIYNARSRTLHGELTQVDSATWFNARRIAAAVFVAACERRIFMSRIDGNNFEKQRDWLDELKERSYEGGENVGVTQTDIYKLWRE